MAISPRPHRAAAALLRRCRRPHGAATATLRRSYCDLIPRRSYGDCFVHAQNARRPSAIYATARRSYGDHGDATAMPRRAYGAVEIF